MKEDFVSVFLILVALIVAGGAIYAHISRSKSLLKKWVDENRYQLLRAEHRVFRKGPFLWATKGQAVYRIEVYDERGINRKGWIKCGSPLSGMLSDKVAVKWDA